MFTQRAHAIKLQCNSQHWGVAVMHLEFKSLYQNSAGEQKCSINFVAVSFFIIPVLFPPFSPCSCISQKLIIWNKIIKMLKTIYIIWWSLSCQDMVRGLWGQPELASVLSHAPLHLMNGWLEFGSLDNILGQVKALGLCSSKHSWISFVAWQDILFCESAESVCTLNIYC